MEKDIDAILFERLKQVGKRMRPGRPCGGNIRGREEGKMQEEIDDGLPPFRPPVFEREFILILLSKMKSSMRQKDIAKRLLISPSTLSEMVNKLVADGYILRNPDPRDRRATLLGLTEKGQQRAAEMEAERKRMIQNRFRNLNTEEKEELIYLLEKLMQ